MNVPAWHVAPDAIAAAHDVAERVRAFRERRGVESSASARLYAWLRYAPAYHSNALEGGELTETETKAVLVDGLTVPKPLRDHLWAVNLAVAVERVDQWGAEPGPISESQILALNAILLRGIDEPGAGAYRRVAVYLTGDDFEPPPPDEVPARMQALLAWLAASDDDGAGSGEPIVQAARLGAWFEAIHPFVDGNGRAGRLLVDLLLLKRGLIRALVRAEARDRHRQALQQARAGELTPLVQLLTDSVAMMLAEHERASQPR
jgi:Fic family protein